AEDGIRDRNVTGVQTCALPIFMMFVPKKGIDDIPFDEVTFNKWLASALSFMTGIGAGIVGAAGAFILVPIMLLVLKIPTRMTIASEERRVGKEWRTR